MTKETSKLYSDPELAQFYNATVRDRQDFKVISHMASKARSVLDLGCGTGVLSAMLADNSMVVAVDPAKAMLDIARKNHGDKNIEWIEGDARDIHLNRKFDFIVLSGHAFQVFLTPADQLRVFNSISMHLNKGGRFVFDSRNPRYPRSKERTKSQTLKMMNHSTLGQIEAWNESTYDEASGILTYENFFRSSSKTGVISAQEKIKYTPKSELSTLISKTGLEIKHCHGDWDETPFYDDAREIIIVGGAAV